MPEYSFVDRNGHDATMIYSFSEYMQAGPVICAECGEEMQRKYEGAPHINWAGLKPNAGRLTPDVQNLLNTAPQRRDEFEREHEEHEHRTESY